MELATAESNSAIEMSLFLSLLCNQLQIPTVTVSGLWGATASILIANAQ
jgi:hypothetical protein